MTKLTIETKYVIINITLPIDELSLDEFTDSLLEPMLLSLGYHPNSVAELFGQEITEWNHTIHKNLGVIKFDDLSNVDRFISDNKLINERFLAGLHVGAGKIQNRWSYLKYSSLIKKMNQNHSINFYLTGSEADKKEIEILRNELDFDIKVFINRPIPEVAVLISKSDIFIYPPSSTPFISPIVF